MEKTLQRQVIRTDVLVIGGGTAGCFAALTLDAKSDLSVVIAEKANIKRSGCLAAGVNAINAYITEGRRPEDYVDYASKDAKGIVRNDLLLSAARRFNSVTAKMEELGLVILKDENGKYAARGNRNIKINGENFKPILADAVKKCKNVRVINHLNITDLLISCGKVYGAVGYSVEEREAYVIYANAVLISTGGAAGLYRPNNPGFSRHKMWYPPFNTGAGYAMGLKAGAEMTTFEMRFIALRCKDTIAPTGTIAQGVRAPQVNSKGEIYEKKYGLATSERVYGTVEENRNGNGPCFLRTEGIGKEKDEELLKAYLNMAPSQTLKWLEEGKNPSEQNVEIEGTEPYIVGGHTASGFWVNTNRETTVHGLYAAGDVAGGCPQKYVTGALAEGEIAAEDMIRKAADIAAAASTSGSDNGSTAAGTQGEAFFEKEVEAIVTGYERFLGGNTGLFSVDDVEEVMQKVMDEYAGGISSGYRYNRSRLLLADTKIEELIKLSETLHAENMHELLFISELEERLLLCKAVIAHLEARKETRWHSFNENQDFPEENEELKKYLNSKLRSGKIETFWRELVTGESYEHAD